MSEKKKLALGLAFFAGLLFFELPGSRLFDPDEARYAEIPREMLASGDYLTPHLNGSNYFEKPPLLYWVNAASMKLLGETPYAARLPVRLATLGTTLLLIFFLARQSTSNAGLWAALIFLSTPLSFVLGRTNLTDGLLSFSLTLSFLSLRGFLRAIEEDTSTLKYQLGLGIGIALAFLSKGLIGIIFPAAVLFAWTGLLGKWRLNWRVIFSWAPIIFLLIAAPWFILMEKTNPGFSRFFFIHEHFERFATHEAKREGPVYYFIITFILGFLPWTFFFGEALKPITTFRREKLKAYSNELFFGLWFASIIAFFSVSHSKLTPYIFPAFPAAAALLGKKLADSQSNFKAHWKIAKTFWAILIPVGVAYGIFSGFLGRYGLVAHGVAIGIFILAGVGSGKIFTQAICWGGVFATLAFSIPKISADYSSFDLAITAQNSKADQIVSFGLYPQSFPWALKRPLPVVDFQGELASDGQKSPALFWSRNQFWKEWNSDKKIIVCAHRDDLAKLNATAAIKPITVAENRKLVLLSNFDIK